MNKTDLDALDKRITELRDDVKDLSKVIVAKQEQRDVVVTELVQKVVLIEQKVDEVYEPTKVLIAKEKSRTTIITNTERLVIVVGSVVVTITSLIVAGIIKI